MPSTIAHALFPAASVIIAGSALPRLDKRGWAKLVCLAAFLGNSPDLDLIPASLFPMHWNYIHRNFGHNIFSITALTIFGTWLLRRFVSREIPKAQAAFMVLSLVCSHLVLDSLADFTLEGERPAIPFLFPLSDWSFYLPWRLFPVPALADTPHPFLNHVFSVEFWTKVVFVEIGTSVALGVVWGGVFQLYFRLAKRKRQPGVAAELPLTRESTAPLKRAAP